LDSNILHHLPPISLIGEFLLNQIFEAVVIYFLIFLVPIIIPRNFPAKFVKAFMRTFSGLFIVLYFVAGLSFYPGLIHAFIARSFSGGQPILADIRVAEEFAKFGQEIGKNLLTGCLMQRQVVIYSDSNNIYLLRYEGRPPKTIVIPKKYVEYMIIHKQENKGNQTKIEKTETPAVKEKLVPD
jgi:energy-coupling factor transporter transmembrane protein EcfT